MLMLNVKKALVTFLEATIASLYVLQIFIGFFLLVWQMDKCST